MVALPESEVTLDVAALLISAHVRPQDDGSEAIGRSLAVIDEIAASCAQGDLSALRRHFFGELGFRGDVENYSNISNSLLDRVVERRRGIPISLSVLLMEVGRRCGVELEGIGMPGHFLVRSRQDPNVLLDPFGGGALVTRKDCEALLKRALGSDFPFDEDYLAQVDSIAILRRMLMNLVLGASGIDELVAGRSASLLGTIESASSVGGTSRHIPRQAEALPMFPLSVPLLPGGYLRLHVFEERFVSLMADCMAKDGTFGVVLIERGSEVGGGETRFNIATRAKILHVTRSEDGRLVVLAAGTERIAVSAWLPDDPFPRAQLEALPADSSARSGSEQQIWSSSDRRSLERAVIRVRALAGEANLDLPPLAQSEPLRLSDNIEYAIWEAAAVTPLGPLDRYKILSTITTEGREALIHDLLASLARDLGYRLSAP